MIEFNYLSIELDKYSDDTIRALPILIINISKNSFSALFLNSKLDYNI